MVFFLYNLPYRQSPRCSRVLRWHVCVPKSPTPRTSASGSRPTGKDISTETALLDVLDRVHTAANSKEVILLMGLDLSAAFDTVCHLTLTKRLQTEFGVSGTPGTALSWIQSYLQDRTQFLKLGQRRSSETIPQVGVPQGSVLGPLLFAVYCSLVADVIASHDVRCHQ